MHIEEIGPDRLPEYAQVSIAFEVRSILRVESLDSGWGRGSGGMTLLEQPVSRPYWKDYDVCDEDGPLTWARDFDLVNWGFFLAVNAGKPVGAAALAHNTPGVWMLERRSDLAVLWDIRIQPWARRAGLGRELFWRAVDWARQRGCRQVKIETQANNVSACHFYAAQGCELGAISRYAYAGHPKVSDEVMLLWYLDL